MTRQDGAWDDWTRIGQLFTAHITFGPRANQWTPWEEEQEAELFKIVNQHTNYISIVM